MNIKTLKTEVWKKAKGNDTITKGNHHYEDIRYAILEQTGHKISRDTIRNFIEDRNQPSGRTLDIYATFVLGGNEQNHYTFQDFIGWCAKKNEHQRPEEKLPSYRFASLAVAFLVIMLLLILFLLWKIYTPIAPMADESHDYYFLDSFLVEDVNTLYNNGWQILDPDQKFLDTLAEIRYKEDYLTLFTLNGDYWDVWGGASEKLEIKNMFVHQIDCKCCMITTKIDRFFPTEKHQQAGIFLFDGLDKENFLRVTYKYYPKDNGHPNRPWVQVVQMKNKKMTDLGLYILERVKLDANTPHKSIGFLIEVTENKIEISYNVDNRAFFPFIKLDNFLKVNYVGLGAFKGPYSNAPVIPVHYDFVEVLGCDAKIQ